LSQSLLLRRPVLSPRVRRWPSSVRGLQLRYKFDEGAGKKAFDSSGLHRHGTINGTGLYAPSLVGKCLYFDGTGDYVATPSFGLSGTVVVFACRTRCKKHTDYQMFFARSGTHMLLRLPLPDSEYLRWYYAAPGQAYAQTSFLTSTYEDVWLHLCVVCDYAEKACYFYRNAILIASLALTGTPVFPSFNAAMYIGVYNDGASYLLTAGYLADVQLWTLATMPPPAVMNASAWRMSQGLWPIW